MKDFGVTVSGLKFKAYTAVSCTPFFLFGCVKAATAASHIKYVIKRHLSCEAHFENLLLLMQEINMKVE